MLTLQCIVLAALFCHTLGISCNDCLNNYVNSRNQPRKSNAQKCGYLKIYISCLYSTTTGCASSTNDVAAIVTDYRQFGCVFEGVCQCQLSFYTAYPRYEGLDTVCGLINHQLKCARTFSKPSCNRVFRNGDQYYTHLLSLLDRNICIVGDTCACEITLSKLQQNCQTYMNTVSCLASSTTQTCDGRYGKDELAETVTNEMESSCSEPSDACQCEVDAAISPTTSYSKSCSTLHTLYDCLNDVYNENITKIVCDGEDSDDRATQVRITGGLKLCVFSLSSAVCISVYIPLLLVSLWVGLKYGV